MNQERDTAIPLVSAIVVNRNGGAMLHDALASLFAQTWPALEVILVDNASSDGSADQAARCFGDRLTVIRNAKNEGFARGNNIGFKAARGDWIFLLNPDAICDPDVIAQLMQFVAGRADVGQLACRVVRASQPNFFDSAGLLLYPDGVSRPRGWQEKDQGQYDRAEEVLAPHGCACALRKAMLDQIGDFDEDFFCYFEDLDLGVRGQLAGWKCWYSSGRACPSSEISDGWQLLGLQGLSRRAQPAVLPVEVDAALSRVRCTTLHDQPLCDAGLRRHDASGPVRRLREGILGGATRPALDPGSSGGVLPLAAHAR